MKPEALHDFKHVAGGSLHKLAELAHAGVSIQAQRVLLIAFVFIAVTGCVFQSVANPRGMIRRMSTGYVAQLDAQQRWMFLPETGARIAWTQLLTVFVVLTLHGVTPHNALPAIAFLVIVVPPVVVSRQVKTRRATIDDQSNGFALALASALKSTASIGDALKGATDVTPKPLQDELGTVLRQIRIGSTLEEALLSLSARVQSTALDVVVSTLLIGRQTGGDLPRILEGTAASLRELKRLERLTDRVTRGARQSLGLSAILTVAIAVMLPFMFPGFLNPLRTTVKGQIMAAQLLLIFFGALYLGYRFTRKSI